MTIRERTRLRIGAAVGAAAIMLASSSAPAEEADARHPPCDATNPVIAWDLIAQTAIWDVAGQVPWEQSRSFTMVHAAIYDAVNAITGVRYEPYLVAPRAAGFESLDAAVATAAYEVLVSLFPDQEPTLRQQYDAALAEVSGGAAKQGGIRVGHEAAGALLAARQNDGAFGPETWAVGDQPGQWRPTPPFFGSGGAWVAHMKPFAIPNASMFRTPGPPALTSSAYADDLNEVQQVGSVSSTVRTADQTEAAIFWHDRHLAEWEIKRQVATTQRLNTLEAARMFAMVDVAQVDSGIVCFVEKEKWSFWRPVTAIQLADSDGNPATAADPSWMPLLITPPFPEYTSGHACTTSAAMHTFEFFFGRDDIAFSASSAESGTTRHFGSFSQALAEVIEARIWGGVHFRSADREGANIGAGVSTYVTHHYFRHLRRSGQEK